MVSSQPSKSRIDLQLFLLVTSRVQHFATVSLNSIYATYFVVDGGYTEWTTFSECSRTCDVGKTSRSRYCNNPRPAHGGKMCPQGAFEEQNKPCKVAECPGKDFLKFGVHKVPSL